MSRLWVKEMNLRRILAVIRRDFWIIRKIRYGTIRVFYFPITMILIWGFFVNWARDIAVELAFILLAVNIFWQLAQHTQGGTNIQIMEDRWSESYKQIVLTPIRPIEYLFGKFAFAIILSLTSFTIIYLMAYLFFHFTVLAEQLVSFIILSSIMLIASLGIATIVESFILVLGNEYGFLSWSSTQLIILLSAPFFPMTTYPLLLQGVSAVMPYTWVFEGVRALVNTGVLDSVLLLRAFVVAFLYLTLSIVFYNRMFEKARMEGKLVKTW